MRLLTLHQVRNLTTLSKPEIYRRIKRGEFPAQVRLGASRVAWLESDVETWIKRQVEQSQNDVELLPTVLPKRDFGNADDS